MKKKTVVPLVILFIILGLGTVAMGQRMVNRFHSEWGSSASTKFLNTLEWSFYDFKMRNKDREIARGILVATIDDRSLERFGRWPWNREVYRGLVDGLFGWGASSVGFDAVFSEPEFQSERIKRQLLPSTEDRDALEALGDRPTLDENTVDQISQLLPRLGVQQFALAVARNPETVLGYIWQSENYCNIYDPESAENKERYGRVLSVREAASLGYVHMERFVEDLTSIQNQSILVDGTEPLDSKDATNLFPVYDCPVTNLGTLSAVAKHQGYFNAIPDSDGIFRRIPLVVGFSPRLVPSGSRDWLPEAWFKQATFFPSLTLKSVVAHWNRGELSIPLIKVNLSTDASGRRIIKSVTVPRKGKADLDIPTLPDGTIAINFFGPQNTRPESVGEFSLGDLPVDAQDEALNQHLNTVIANESFQKVYGLDATNPKTPLKDQVVLIGPTAIGVYDLRPNPVQGDAAGVFLHATLAGRILELEKTGSAKKLGVQFASLPLSVGLLWLVGLLCGIFLVRLSAVNGALAALLTLAALIAVDVIFVFPKMLLSLETITTVLAAGTGAVSILAYRYFTEERERAFVKGAFEKYVSPDVVGAIIEDPKKLNLGGQKKTLSVLFSDIRGFTTISEKMKADELAKFMNDYLSPMTDIVLENRGTIDKYMGDAIMAIFGAPIEYSNHPEKAVDAALGMLSKLKELKANWAAQGLPEIDIGIGINTGDMSVGNMGSRRIFSYTVMGDSVNLGSRLEGINKEYGTRLIVSESTRQALSADYVCRELDRVKVKGKKLPVTIFEVIGRGALDAERLLAQRFEAALALYYAEKFIEAMALFQGLASQDKTSVIYVERCRQWIDTPPESGWDGSWTMKTK